MNRRSFLKAMGASITGALLPASVFGHNEKLTEEERLLKSLQEHSRKWKPGLEINKEYARKPDEFRFRKGDKFYNIFSGEGFAFNGKRWVCVYHYDTKWWRNAKT